MKNGELTLSVGEPRGENLHLMLCEIPQNNERFFAEECCLLGQDVHSSERGPWFLWNKGDF